MRSEIEEYYEVLDGELMNDDLPPERPFRIEHFRHPDTRQLKIQIAIDERWYICSTRPEWDLFHNALGVLKDIETLSSRYV